MDNLPNGIPPGSAPWDQDEPQSSSCDCQDVVWCEQQGCYVCHEHDHTPPQEPDLQCDSCPGTMVVRAVNGLHDYYMCDREPECGAYGDWNWAIGRWV
jgi:hypothetical protein